MRMTDTEMAQKAPTDVHGLGENQYKIIFRVIFRYSIPSGLPINRKLSDRLRLQFFAGRSADGQKTIAEYKLERITLDAKPVSAKGILESIPV